MRTNISIKLAMCIILIFVNDVGTISVDSNDLMNGQGLFLGSSVSAFSNDNIHVTSFISWNGSNVLKLVKPDGAHVSYENGLKYTFNSQQIKHVQFKFASSSPDTQDSNMRLMDSNSTTLILFRAGRGGLIRVNEKQMISFYNSSVSTDSDIKLTQVDFKIKWDQKIIQVFIDNKFVDTCDFFNSTVQSVSQIMLYNLYSSTSYWSDVVVCSQICYGFNSQLFAKVQVALLCLITMILLNINL